MDQQLYQNLKAEFAKTPADLPTIGKLVQALMLQLATSGSLALIHSTPEVTLAIQDILEMAVFWAVHAKDGAAFERYTAQLIPIYLKGCHRQDRMYTLVGLYLLHLIVSKRTSDFYSLLERITAASKPPSAMFDAGHRCIQFAVQLQQCLVEGTFHRILLARQQVPAPEYAWFLDSLMGTLRNELAECLEKAYDSLDISSTAARLLIGPEQIPQLISFAQQRGWAVDQAKGLISFKLSSPAPQASLIAGADEAYIGVIRQSLQYANNLEKIY